MDFTLSKKRARSQSVEAEEPPNKKLCASEPSSKRSAEMSATAEKHKLGEPDMMSSDNGFDADFDAEFEAVFNEDEESELVSRESSLEPPAETSEERAAMVHLESNMAEKPSTPPTSSASSISNKLSTATACSSPRLPSSSPETSITSTSHEASPGPPDSIKSTPQDTPCTAKAGRSKKSKAPKPSAKPRSEYVGPSFRGRRPLTDEDREMVRKAIEYTYQDLYKRTKIKLGIMDTEKGRPEQWDTTLESFGYQYGRAQHRYRQYLEKKDLEAGMDITSKKYIKESRKRFGLELLLEVEGPWQTGFDDWKPPGAIPGENQATNVIDLSND